MNAIIAPEDFESLGIHTVLIATPDLNGRPVGRRIPASRYAGIVEAGIEICTCAWAWDIDQSFELIGQNVLAVCGMHNGVPDVALIPDPTTLRRAAWLDGVAVCIADPVHPRTREPLDISPRVLLRRELERWAESGLRPSTGTELEFYLFRNEPRALRAADFRGLEPTTQYPSDFSLHEGNAYEPFFAGLRRDLEASGIEMEAAQSEWGLGQWEMTFRYQEPLEMADRHMLYKLAVRDVATAAGMSATFMAQPLNGQPGSSCHIHLSARDEHGTPVFWDAEREGNRSQLLESAIAGALEHTPELMAWYAPTINAYRRTNSEEVAGYGRTWGVDNRTVTARVVGHSENDRRVEFRLPGADVNPYLALTGLLSSARDGIARTAQPPAMTVGNAYDQPVDEGVPRNLHEAATAFRASAHLREVLGEETVEHYAIMADWEWTEHERSVSDWQLRRYFDRI